MKTIGIIAEYNPFHTGHAWHIAQTRRLFQEETAVAAVMSGNWVQRGECAAADKWTRTEMALAGGVDLVLELPTVWATASAEGFAKGAVSLLAATGVVDVLSFGSELGEIDPLWELAQCLNSPEFTAALRRELGPKRSFAQCRRQAVERLLGADMVVADVPLYDTIPRAADAETLRRRLADGTLPLAAFASASAVRGFAQAAQGCDLSSVRAACIGPQAGQAARAHGFRTVTAKTASIDALIDCILEEFPDATPNDTPAPPARG